jgi:hypothetical protein
MKPTPTPWIAVGYDVRQPNGRHVAYTGPHHTLAEFYPPACKAEDEANARFIARACNNYDALVDALRPFADYLSIMETMGGTTPKSGPVWAVCAKAGNAEITVEDMQRARAALALATGKESA